ncbi:MAG: hypothetical protein WC326_14710 [Candidatus Delongbacteria bacterium]
MKFYWFTHSIPELAGLPKARRTELLVATMWKPFGHWQVWLTNVLFGGSFYLLAAYGRELDSWILKAGAIFLVVGGGSLLNWNVKLHYQRQYIRALLDG